MMPAPGLDLLRQAVYVMAGIVALLSLVALAWHGVAAAVSRRAARRRAELAPVLHRVLETVPPDFAALPPLSRFDRRVVRGMLHRLALDLRGETRESMIAVYRHLGLLAGELDRLRSRRASWRARAAANLGLIGAPEALPALLAATRDRNAWVRGTAVWAVGQAGGPAELAALVALLGDNDCMVGGRAQEVLAERGRGLEHAILAYAERTDSRAGRLAAIELLGWLRVADAADLLERLMDDPDSEIRVKSVKAAAAIGAPQFLEPFHQRLRDPEWPVRCQAAKGLAGLGSPRSIPRLEKALRDRHWWVRFHAAVALAELGETGEAALLRALQDARPRVRDMARYLLERGAAVPALP